MESEILQELVTIRVYIFIIMSAVVLWVLMYAIAAAQKIIVEYKKVINAYFVNDLLKIFDLGEYEKIIKDCSKMLEKYLNHTDVTWYLARAYYYTENNNLSLEYFNKAVYLVPSWEEDAGNYIKKLNER